MVEFDRLTIMITMTVYLVLMLGFIIYLVKTQKQEKLEDYTLGGRQLGWLTSSLSAMASQSSGFMLIGFVGLGYTLGGFAVWYVLTDCLNVILLWTFFARKMKSFGDHYKAIDVPDLLSMMYNDRKNVLRIVSSIAVIVFMMGYVSSQVTAAAKTIGPIIDIPFLPAIIIGTLAVLVYTVFAGYTGVAVTDTVQGFLMMIACFVTPIVAVSAAGGWGGLQTALAEAEPLLLTTRGAMPFTVALAMIIGWVSVSFSCWGQPHVVTRIMAIRDPKFLKNAALMSTFFFAFTRAAALIIGMSARAILPEIDDPEWAFPLLVGELFNPVVAGIMICALAASIITTANSQLLAASTSLIRNIYQKLFKSAEAVSEEKLIRLTKLVTVVIAVVCALLAIRAQGVVFWMVLFAYVGSGAALGIPLVLGFFWKRANYYGAVAGVFVGFLAVMGWKIAGLDEFLHEGVPGLILAAIAVLIGSLVTKPEKRDVVP